jgi:hypothetical protein
MNVIISRQLKTRVKYNYELLTLYLTDEEKKA